MARKFKKPNYEDVLKQTIILEEALPSNHLARFVVDVIAQLDLGPIYAQYAPVGGRTDCARDFVGIALLWLRQWRVQFSKDRESHL